jgi:hypothetical protein
LQTLKLYQSNTVTAKQYFCSNCSIYTHYQWRSNQPSMALMLFVYKILTF